MSEYPWEHNQELSKERITELANLISQVRAEVIERHDEVLGDTPLSLGMRCYECCRTRIIGKSQDSTFPWLTILTDDKRFTFSFGDSKVPVRFTRNDPNNLPDKKLLVSEEAQVQYDMFNQLLISHAEIRWYLVFDTYFKSPADAVFFVGYREDGDIFCKWQVPLDGSITLISDISKELPEPIEKSKPRIGIKKRQDETAKKSKLDKSRDNEE